MTRREGDWGRGEREIVHTLIPAYCSRNRIYEVNIANFVMFQ